MFVLDTYKRLPVTFVKGEGIYLYDTNGKRYVDLISGIGVSVLGYGDAGMVKIIKKRAEELLHISNLFENPWQDKLAEKLIKHFGSKGKVFFCNSGTEANEAGIKFLRKYWYKQGSKRYRIITFKGGFHGRTYGSLSATAQERFHKGFEPLLDGFDYAEFNNFDSVVKSLRDDTGGIMLEIIQGEGGINEADGDFLLKIQDLCKREGVIPLPARLPFMLFQMLLKLLERGIVANCTGNGVLRLLPPYIIDEGTAEFVIRNMKEII